MDDEVAQFTAITGSSPVEAQQYLRLSDGNLEHAIQLFFDSGGIDLGAQPGQAIAQPPLSAPEPARRPQGTMDRDGVIHIDSDGDFSDEDDDSMGYGSQQQAQPRRTRPSGRSPLPPVSSTPHNVPAIEDDEAMARRMQEELYGESMGRPGNGADDVRAPIARTTETLVGPDADYGHEMPRDMRAAIDAQIAARRRRAAGRPGIFNQQVTDDSVWDSPSVESGDHRQVLSHATGGASEASKKASLLAELYRPPHELISRLPWEDARQEGKTVEKWILVNVQDPSIFDCQVLNRDIWKNAEIQSTVKENFIFMQYNKDDPRGSQYIQFYFKTPEDQDSYPHIAIVDPRTGEQVKVWSGPPVPKPMDYLMQLHEFLDRYSLKANAKNPVATRRPEKKKIPDVDRMTEEEMMEMALQNSLGNGGNARENDPDALTRDAGANSSGKGKGKERAVDLDMGMEGEDSGMDAASGQAQPSAPSPSPFSQISSSHLHVEPAANAPDATRIQFRHSGGRIIRRFALSDEVRRLFEWLKAEPLEGKAGVEFELVCMGRNLMDHIQESIDEAGLKNQTVMIEYLED